jgi:hypothetical protein
VPQRSRNSIQTGRGDTSPQNRESQLNHYEATMTIDGAETTRTVFASSAAAAMHTALRESNVTDTFAVNLKRVPYTKADRASRKRTLQTAEEITTARVVYAENQLQSGQWTEAQAELYRCKGLVIGSYLMTPDGFGVIEAINDAGEPDIRIFGSEPRVGDVMLDGAGRVVGHIESVNPDGTCVFESDEGEHGLDLRVENQIVNYSVRLRLIAARKQGEKHFTNLAQSSLSDEEREQIKSLFGDVSDEEKERQQILLGGL